MDVFSVALPSETRHVNKPAAGSSEGREEARCGVLESSRAGWHRDNSDELNARMSRPSCSSHVAEMATSRAWRRAKTAAAKSGGAFASCGASLDHVCWHDGRARIAAPLWSGKQDAGWFMQQ